ncbi:uncharacterized, partial [Tachysurus ichikawai]
QQRRHSDSQAVPLQSVPGDIRLVGQKGIFHLLCKVTKAETGNRIDGGIAIY